MNLSVLFSIVFIMAVVTSLNLTADNSTEATRLMEDLIDKYESELLTIGSMDD